MTKSLVHDTVTYSAHSDVTEGNGTFECDKVLSLWFITTVTCSVHSKLIEVDGSSECEEALNPGYLQQ